MRQYRVGAKGLSCPSIESRTWIKSFPTRGVVMRSGVVYGVRFVCAPCSAAQIIAPTICQALIIIVRLGRGPSLLLVVPPKVFERETLTAQYNGTRDLLQRMDSC